MVTNIAMSYQQFNLATQLNGFKYYYLTLIIKFNIICLCTVKCLNYSIWPIEGTLSDTITQRLNGHRSDSNEELLNIL